MNGKGTQIVESLLLASTDGVPATDTGGRFMPLRHTEQRLQVVPYVWNPDTLAYEPQEKAAAGTGGAGDASAANQVTEIARLEAIRDRLPPALSGGGRLLVELPAGGGGLTDLELRATPVPVSLAGSATAANQDLIIDGIDALLTELLAKVEPGDTVLADVTDEDTRVLGRVKVFDALGNVITVAKDSTLTDGSQVANVSDRDARLLGRAKLLDSAGVVIDPATKAQLPATLGQKTMAASMAVVVASDQANVPVAVAAALPVGGNNIGDVDVLTLPGVEGKAATDAVVVGNPVLLGAQSCDGLATAVSADGDVVPLWTTRRGAQVISLTREQVRVVKSFRFTSAAAPAADTICSCIANTDGVDGAGATTFAVTAGKRLRFTHATLYLRTTTAATPWGLLSIRMNPVGAAVIGSPVVHWLGVGGTAAVIGNTAADVLIFPEGWEISGTKQVAFTFANNVATNVTNFVVHGYEYTP